MFRTTIAAHTESTVVGLELTGRPLWTLHLISGWMLKSSTCLAACGGDRPISSKLIPGSLLVRSRGSSTIFVVVQFSLVD